MEGVDVASLLLDDVRVVKDGVLVSGQFGEAVGPVVVGFDVVASVLELVGVVLDGQLIPLKLTVDEASVRVNDWILVIKPNSIIEVRD